MYPDFPTEPAIRAILKQSPALDASEIDFFGYGNTFDTLLSYSRNESRTFRFGMERVGHAFLLVRKTNTRARLWKKSEVTGIQLAVFVDCIFLNDILKNTVHYFQSIYTCSNFV